MHVRGDRSKWALYILAIALAAVAPAAMGSAEGSPWRQWQNLLLHEALHFIDVQRRGRSDHSNEFRRLAREFGVAYQHP